MAGTNVSVDWELLRGKASDLRNLRGDHDTNMTAITTLINNLTEVWTGPAQEQLVAGFTELKPSFDKFGELVDAYINLLEADARSYEEHETTTAANQNVTFG